MAKLTLLVNSVNRVDRSLVEQFRAAGLAARVVDACEIAELRAPKAERVSEYDRPVREIPTLLVDSDDGKREIARFEGGRIDAPQIAGKLRDGSFAKADAGAPAIVRLTSEREPGAAALARIKAGKGTLEDVLEFIATRY